MTVTVDPVNYRTKLNLPFEGTFPQRPVVARHLRRKEPRKKILISLNFKSKFVMMESCFQRILWKFLLISIITFGVVFAGHYLNADGTPFDPYHDLHLPHYPSLYPTYRSVPRTGFSCYGLGDQLWADLGSSCQAYHLCYNQQMISSHLCVNGTLFNQQFQTCDHFYNVRCGNPHGDL